MRISFQLSSSTIPTSLSPMLAPRSGVTAIGSRATSYIITIPAMNATKDPTPLSKFENISMISWTCKSADSTTLNPSEEECRSGKICLDSDPMVPSARSATCPISRNWSTATEWQCQNWRSLRLQPVKNQAGESTSTSLHSPVTKVSHGVLTAQTQSKSAICRSSTM